MPQELTDDKSTLAQVMARCPQTTSLLTESMLNHIYVAILLFLVTNTVLFHHDQSTEFGCFFALLAMWACDFQ